MIRLKLTQNKTLKNIVNITLLFSLITVTTGLFLDESGESLKSYLIQFQHDVDQTVDADNCFSDVAHLVSPHTTHIAAILSFIQPHSHTFTVAGARHLSRYVTSHPCQLSLAIPAWVGAMSTSQRAVTPCGWGV